MLGKYVIFQRFVADPFCRGKQRHLLIHTCPIIYLQISKGPFGGPNMVSPEGQGGFSEFPGLRACRLTAILPSICGPMPSLPSLKRVTHGELSGSPVVRTPHFHSRGPSLVVSLVKNVPALQETQVRSLGQDDPWQRKWQPTPVSFPEISHG